jgi:hypothetical protein
MVVISTDIKDGEREYGHKKAKTTALGAAKKGNVGKSVLVRFRPELLEALDAWCAERLTRPSRPEAVRRIVEAGLKAGRRRK